MNDALLNKISIKDMKKKNQFNEKMNFFYILMNVWSEMMKWMKTLRQICVMFFMNLSWTMNSLFFWMKWFPNTYAGAPEFITYVLPVLATGHPPVSHLLATCHMPSSLTIPKHKSQQDLQPPSKQPFFSFFRSSPLFLFQCPQSRRQKRLMGNSQVFLILDSVKIDFWARSLL